MLGFPGDPTVCQGGPSRLTGEGGAGTRKAEGQRTEFEAKEKDRKRATDLGLSHTEFRATKTPPLRL